MAKVAFSLAALVLTFGLAALVQSSRSDTMPVQANAFCRVDPCTPTPTVTPCLPPGCTATVTPTPTSNRPVPKMRIDLTANGQQGPITITLGDVVTYRWVLDLDRQSTGFHGSVDDEDYDALDYDLALGCSPRCERSVTAQLLTPGPDTHTVSTSACNYPAYCSSAEDSVTVIVTPESGDSDCDRTVTAVDAALILQRDAGLKQSLPCPQAADVNGDGAANALDVSLILQYVAGLIDSLPV